MKENLIELIRAGNLQEALAQGEDFLKLMNDNYLLWTTLQSRFNDKQNQSTKGLLSGEELTKEINLLNSQLLDLVLKIDGDLELNQSTSNEEKTLKDNLQNELLGSYEVLDVLNEGALSVTYKAKEVFDEDLVAIKTLKYNDYTKSSDILNEVNKVKQFNHRNIISILGKSPNISPLKYVILEYIDGLSLRKIIEENGPRPISETQKIILKLCQALYYLHKRKTFDADLRASRIFIDKEGEPIFAAFIFFKNKSNSNYNQMVSNLKYMSMERLNAKDYRFANPQTNQFSIGVLAYLLITGEPLFAGDSIIDLLEIRKRFDNDAAYRKTKLDKLDCSQELKDVVVKLLSTNRSDRFPNMYEVIRALQAIKPKRSEEKEISHESYSRACSCNPKIAFELINGIAEKNQAKFENVDLNDFAKKFHHTINLIIETDSNKSYLLKAIESKELAHIFLESKTLFKENFYQLLEECDYLWSEEVRQAWDKTLEETFEEVDKCR